MLSSFSTSKLTRDSLDSLDAEFPSPQCACKCRSPVIHRLLLVEMLLDEMLLDEMLLDEMLLDEMLLDEMLLDEMLLDEMLLDEMLLDEMLLDEMLLDEMLLDEMLLDEMLLDEMLLDEMLLDEMLLEPLQVEDVFDFSGVAQELTPNARTDTRGSMRKKCRERLEISLKCGENSFMKSHELIT